MIVIDAVLAVPKIIYGAMLGLVLGKLYGMKPCPRSILFAGGLASLPFTLLIIGFKTYTLRSHEYFGSVEFLPILTMAGLIGTVLQVTLPAIFIERALRQRAARISHEPVPAEPETRN